MGSGATRNFWASKGSRSARRSGTKSMAMRRKGDGRWKSMKAWRAEAKHIASGR